MQDSLMVDGRKSNDELKEALKDGWIVVSVTPCGNGCLVIIQKGKK